MKYASADALLLDLATHPAVVGGGVCLLLALALASRFLALRAYRHGYGAGYEAGKVRGYWRGRNAARLSIQPQDDDFFHRAS
jgi:hypothetical protein